MRREVTRESRALSIVWGALAVTVACAGCSDSHLYGIGMEDPTADRLGLTGRVCTDDPREAGFPVKVLFLVDTAMGPMFGMPAEEGGDPEMIRLQALRDTLAIHSGNDAFSFAVASFGPYARKLAPEEGYFTRNPGELENGVSMLALPQGCMSEICRDYGDGLTLARSMIEGDMATLTPGERSRTQYVIVLFSGGRPEPRACEYECCDPADEECDESECVQNWACTKTVLRDQVAELRDEIEEQGALSLSLHALLLAVLDQTLGNPEANLDETIDLMQQMAFAGAGIYEQFNVADAITLDHIGLLKLSALLEAKSLLVTNMSVLPGVGDPKKDSDGDGLNDGLESGEGGVGTDPKQRDSDGDGIGDMLELLFSLDPLVSEVPGACEGVEQPYTDLDSDQLNECEEILLGTDPSLPDTDGDALPDWVEVYFGTDYLHPDALTDSDWDGVSNGDETLAHTDPRSSDATSHLGSAYRYDVTDEGIVAEPSVSTPHKITGVDVLEAGADTAGGLGALRYSPGNTPTLAWKDPQDGEFGDAVPIPAAGTYVLESDSNGSQSSDDGHALERWVEVDVDPAQLPPNGLEELLLVEQSERQCLTFTVRNIRLVETESDSGEGGRNNVFVYFAQSPAGQLTLPGLFRVAHIPVTYHPDTGRDPSDPLVLLEDEDFVAIGH